MPLLNQKAEVLLPPEGSPVQSICKSLLLAVIALLPLSGCGCGGGSGEGGSKKLSGSGSSFVKPIMDKWIDVYCREKGNLEINYQKNGSTAGINQMIDKSVDFACTDVPMTEDQLKEARKEGGEVVHIPLVCGGVVPAYNLPGIDKPLRFRGKVLADIFHGDITRWNDDRIKADNKDIDLPNLKISVVNRSGGSGTTAIFTEYLAKVSPEKWEKLAGPMVKWPTGSGEKDNAAVADNIGRSRGAIGYVELLYALQKKDIMYGAVESNNGKTFILANPENVYQAAAGLKKIPDDLCFSLVKDSDTEEGYPISGTTWAVLYQSSSGDKGRQVVDLLRWAIHDGQKYAREMKYAPLPEKLVQRIDEKLNSIKVK
jgi:phosphate transport system substrate-binding protein